MLAHLISAEGSLTGLQTATFSLVLTWPLGKCAWRETSLPVLLRPPVLQDEGLPLMTSSNRN